MGKRRKVGVADRDTVFAVIDDMVANLLYHDRESDEDLPKGEIERLIDAGDLSIDDMVEKFRESLEEHLEDLETADSADEDEEDPDDDFPPDDEDE